MRGNARMIFLMLAFVLASISFSKAQDTIAKTVLSFEQALELTKQNSHVIKQSQLLQQEKEQNLKSSRGLYLPTVGLSASYMMMSDDISLDLTPVRDAITPLYSTLSQYGRFSITGLSDDMATAAVRSQLSQGLTKVQSANWDQTIQEKNFGTVAADFKWPIYVGGKIRAANNVAKLEKKEAEEITRQKEGEITTELVERYFGLSLAKQAVKVRQDVFDGMKKHVDDAEKFEKHGFIANGDVLHAQFYQAQAERELSKAKRTVDIINQALVSTINLDDNAVVEPISELFYLDTIEAIDYYKKLAIEKNPLILQVGDKKQMAEQNYKVQIANFLPQIAVTGMYDIANKDLSPYMPDWMVGVGLKWSIFDGTHYNKARAALLKTKQVEEFQQKAGSDVETMIDKLYNELNMYHEQLVELESAKSFAEELLRTRQKAFVEEMSNATEVVDASLALAQVRIERLQAMYGYDLTLARLLQYSGIPEEYNNYRQKFGVKTESYKSEKIN